MGSFVISKRSSNAYKFVFASRKGKVIFTSKGYELRFECEEEIERLKSSLEVLEYGKKKTASGKYFFQIVLEERVLAFSRKYTTELLMQKGIDEIKRGALKAEILDFSSSEFVFPDTEIQ